MYDMLQLVDKAAKIQRAKGELSPCDLTDKLKHVAHCALDPRCVNGYRPR
jgi:hypothetical protein